MFAQHLHHCGTKRCRQNHLAREFLPLYADCKNFINADLIAQGLSPFAPETMAFRAGRLVLDEINLFAKQEIDFGFETTLSGRSYLNLIRRLKRQGYKVHIFFLWLPNVALALSRIQDRVARGGHNVPEADVRRRFERSLINFMGEYRRLADSWTLFDNSCAAPSVIGFEKDGKLTIINEKLYRALAIL